MPCSRKPLSIHPGFLECLHPETSLRPYVTKFSEVVVELPNPFDPDPFLGLWVSLGPTARRHFRAIKVYAFMCNLSQGLGGGGGLTKVRITALT